MHHVFNLSQLLPYPKWAISSTNMHPLDPANVQAKVAPQSGSS
jgi:hypothetical protein